MTEYNYEYYSVSQKWPKTNTNIIQLPINDQIQIRILFPFTIMTEYKYNSTSPKWSNSINECKFFEPPKRKASKTSSESHKVMLNSPSPLMTEVNYKCKQLPIHMTHPMWLWYMRMNFSFGAQSSFGSAEYSKKNTHPLIFLRGLVDPVIRKVKVRWQIYINKIYIVFRKKFPAVFGFQKITRVRIQIIFGLKNY